MSELSKETEGIIETVSLKDIVKDGSKVVITDIAVTPRRFWDINSQPPSEKTANLMVIRGSVDGKPDYYSTNENTVIYNQLMSHINDLQLGIPVRKVKWEFTIAIKQSGKSKFKYPSIAELESVVDVNKLFP